MEANMEHGAGRRWSPWRIAGWSAAALVLLLPLLTGAPWTVGDYVFAAVLLLGVGVPLDLAVRKTSDAAYRAAAGVALITTLLLVWVNGAVGIIGSEDNDANLLYGGVLAIGLLGALLARFRPRGMAHALVATALAQTSVALGAAIAGLGSPGSGPLEIVFLNGCFVVLWLGSALLFRQATDDTIPSTMKKLKVHATLSSLPIVIGLMLLAYMIGVESEPGGVPLLLIALGTGWYLVTRARIRSHQE